MNVTRNGLSVRVEVRLDQQEYNFLRLNDELIVPWDLVNPSYKSDDWSVYAESSDSDTITTLHKQGQEWERALSEEQARLDSIVSVLTNA